MESVLRDLKVGLRVLVREKSFCALAVIVLALGICGVTTMFSVVNGVMLRGFSFPNAPRLMSVAFVDPASRTAQGVNRQVHSLDYEDLRAAQHSFDRLAAYLDGSTINMTVDGHPRRYQGAYVTDDFLRILGVAPMLGRDFTAADNTQGAPKVALISAAVWQRDFGGTPAILGAAVRINGAPATIVGVMPTGFEFPSNEQLWVPLYSEYPPRPRTDPNEVAPAVVGLLKPGVSLDAANAEITTIAARLAQTYPQTNKAFNTGEVLPLIDSFTSPSLRGTLWTMLAFCVGVLLIACVNVMNMQFARATLRAKELAIRSSLGARRGRLLRQMLTESLLVATLGAAAGIALAWGATGWLQAAVHNMDSPPPAWMTFVIDGPALVFTVAATIIAAVASGLLPAWMSSRASTIAVLHDAGRGNTSRTVNLLSRSLVVAQLIVTCVLLIGALLQTRSILAQEHVDYGYDTTGLMTARMGLMEAAYPTADARKAFYDRLEQRLSDDPTLAGGALTTRFRMLGVNNGAVEIEGRTYTTRHDRLLANFEGVSPDYFTVMGQKLLEGRALNVDDSDARQPVAVVNSAFAEKYWGHASAVGRRFRTTAPDGTQAGPWRTVVGLVSTVRMRGPFNNPGVDDSGFYVPFDVNPGGPTPPGTFAPQFATIVARPRPGQSVDTLAATLRRDVGAIDPNLPLYFVGTPASQLDSALGGNRIIAMMFSIFGIVAVVLASVGIYGVVSFSVGQRTQEFGVRMALGASAGRILTMVLRQGLWQIAIGVGVGVALALLMAAAIGDAIQSVLSGVSGTDPLTYAVVVVVVALVSLAATFIPARRATKVHPMVALRAE